MDRSTIKGMKSLDLKDRESTEGEFRVCVEGYDPSLRGDDLEIALRRHFSPCGTVMNIVIPTHFGSAFLNRSLIRIRGKDAEKKALELNGSNMGGWKLVVKQELNPDLAAKPKTSSCRTNGSGCMCNARCFIKGEGAVEKAVNLNGCGSECECDVIGCKFVAEKNIPRKTVRGRLLTGIGVAALRLPNAKRAKV